MLVKVFLRELKSGGLQWGQITNQVLGSKGGQLRRSVDVRLEAPFACDVSSAAAGCSGTLSEGPVWLQTGGHLLRG